MINRGGGEHRIKVILIRNILISVTLLAMLMISPAISFAATSLHDAAPGTLINFSGKQWMILDQKADGTTYIILNSSDGNRVFDPNNTQLFNTNDSNNIAYYLNNTFYNNLSQKDLIDGYSWDIRFEDGSGSQANVTCKIALISYKEYNNYWSLFPREGTGYYWWTRTPSSGHSTSVYVVALSNGMGSNYVNASLGVRPTLYLKSELLLSDTNDVISVDDLLPKPTKLNIISKSNDYVEFSWDVYENATEYIVYRNNTEIDRTNSPEYTDLNVQGNTQYSYSVKAVVNRKESEMSDPLVVITPLSPVSNFMAMATSINEVQLSWFISTDPGLAGYIIYRDGEEIARVDATQSSYIDQGLVPGTFYSYSIQSYSISGEKSLISPISTTITKNIEKPNLKADKNGTTINLSWAGEGEADYYIIKVNGEEIANTTEKNYTFTGEMGKNYTFEVVAVVQTYLSPSNQVSVKLTPLEPPHSAVGDIVTNIGYVATPIGGLLAMGLAIKASPFLIAIAKAIFLRL